MGSQFSIIQKLGLDTKEYEAGLRAARRNASSWSFRVGKAMGAPFDLVATKIAAIASVGVFTKLANDAIQFGSRLTDMAAATQTNVEALQSLAFAAREAGADETKLQQALVKVTTSAEDARSGLTTYKRAFEALGIDVDKFLALPTERRLEALGRAFVKSGKSTEAYTAITDILGERAGPKLLEVLTRLGTEGFDAVARKAEAAGLVLSAVDAQNLDNLADAIENWKTRALVAIGAVIGRIEYFRARLSDDRLAGTDFMRARRQAVEELAQATGRTIRAGATFSTEELRRTFNADEIVQIERRTQELLTDLMRQGAQDRAEQETAATQSAAAERVRIAREVAATIAEAQKKVEIAAGGTAAQLAEVIRAKREALEVANDETRTEKERLAAAREAARLHEQEARLGKQLASETQSALAREAAARRKMREEEKQKVLEIAELLNAQRAALVGIRGSIGATLREIASGDVKAPGASRQLARRALREEQRAREAALRGNQELADRLLLRAEDLKRRIPGLSPVDLATEEAVGALRAATQTAAGRGGAGSEEGVGGLARSFGVQPAGARGASDALAVLQTIDRRLETLSNLIGTAR